MSDIADRLIDAAYAHHEKTGEKLKCYYLFPEEREELKNWARRHATHVGLADGHGTGDFFNGIPVKSAQVIAYRDDVPYVKCPDCHTVLDYVSGISVFDRRWCEHCRKPFVVRHG